MLPKVTRNEDILPQRWHLVSLDFVHLSLVEPGVCLVWILLRNPAINEDKKLSIYSCTYQILIHFIWEVLKIDIKLNTSQKESCLADNLLLKHKIMDTFWQNRETTNIGLDSSVSTVLEIIVSSSAVVGFLLCSTPNYSNVPSQFPLWIILQTEIYSLIHHTVIPTIYPVSFPLLKLKLLTDSSHSNSKTLFIVFTDTLGFSTTSSSSPVTSWLFLEPFSLPSSSFTLPSVDIISFNTSWAEVTVVFSWLFLLMIGPS